MMFFATRVSDGVVVLVEHDDCGDIVPFTDQDGIEHPAWTTRFVIDGEKFYSQLAKSAVGEGDTRDIQEARYLSDIAFLNILGYDGDPLTSAELDV